LGSPLLTLTLTLTLIALGGTQAEQCEGSSARWACEACGGRFDDADVNVRCEYNGEVERLFVVSEPLPSP